MLKLPGPYDGLKIGLLGGSFNPAHDGHLHVAETAMNTLELDWVWWLVASGNPLKSDHGDFAKRFESAAKYTRSHPRMRVTDIEAQAGLNYSVDVLREILQRAQRGRFVWLMGGDSLASFHQWRSWQTIAQMLPIAVVSRPGSQRAALSSPFAQRFSRSRISAERRAALPLSRPPAWTYLDAPLNYLSSTKIRGQ